MNAIESSPAERPLAIAPHRGPEGPASFGARLSRRLLLAGAVPLLALLAFAGSISLAHAQNASAPATTPAQTPAPVPAALRSAIASLVEGRGFTYAGLCEEVQLPAGSADWCASVQMLGSDRAQVTLGAGDPPATYQATFARSGSSWAATAHDLPYTVSPELRAAIAALVQARGFEYAGLCLEVLLPAGSTAWCANVRSVEGGTAQIAFTPGPWSTEYHATFARSGAGWSATSHNLPFAAPAELQAAIRALVQGRGFAYAGLCNEVNVASMPGVFCATVQLLTATEARVAIGPAASPSVHQATFARNGVGWTATSTDLPLIVPAELRAAIRAFVESRGFAYAGLCSEVRLSSSSTLWCAEVQTAGPNQAQVTIGPASDPDRYHATFIRGVAGWSAAAHDVPLSGLLEIRPIIAAVVERHGHAYAGLCDEIDPSRHAGSWCAVIERVGASTTSVAVGPVGSNAAYGIGLVKDNGVWTVASTTIPLVVAPIATPFWVDDLGYGSAGGGFYWDRVSNQVWTAERGWHLFSPRTPRVFAPLWVDDLRYGSRSGGFYLDPLAGQVWTAERGWHLYRLTAI